MIHKRSLMRLRSKAAAVVKDPLTTIQHRHQPRSPSSNTITHEAPCEVTIVWFSGFTVLARRVRAWAPRRFVPPPPPPSRTHPTQGQTRAKTFDGCAVVAGIGVAGESLDWDAICARCGRGGFGQIAGGHGGCRRHLEFPMIILPGTENDLDAPSPHFRCKTHELVIGQL